MRDECDFEIQHDSGSYRNRQWRRSGWPLPIQRICGLY